MLQTWLPALVEAGIPLLGGLFATLYGFGVIPRTPKIDDTPEQVAKRMGMLKALGPFVMLFGVFLFFTNMPPSIVAPELKWRWVTTLDGVCSVEMPGEPLLKEQQLNSLVRLQEYKGHTLKLTLSDTDPVGLQADTPAEPVFDLFRDNTLNALRAKFPDAKIIADRKINQDFTQGREVQITYENVLLTARFYIVGTHLYQLTAGRINDGDDAVVKRFMESVKLDRRPGPVPNP